MHLFLPRKDHGRLWRRGRTSNRARSWWCIRCNVCALPTRLMNLNRKLRVYSLIIFLAVYLLGGIAYQRTVMHQRGWRQIPNYTVWASIGSLLKDIVVILTSSCSRLLPRRQGYNQLPTSGRGGRGSRADDENRLIDQLDEEWDD